MPTSALNYQFRIRAIRKLILKLNFKPWPPPKNNGHSKETNKTPRSAGGVSLVRWHFAWLLSACALMAIKPLHVDANVDMTHSVITWCAWKRWMKNETAPHTTLYFASCTFFRRRCQGKFKLKKQCMNLSFDMYLVIQYKGNLLWRSWKQKLKPWQVVMGTFSKYLWFCFPSKPHHVL